MADDVDEVVIDDLEEADDVENDDDPSDTGTPPAGKGKTEEPDWDSLTPDQQRHEVKRLKSALARANEDALLHRLRAKGETPSRQDVRQRLEAGDGEDLTREMLEQIREEAVAETASKWKPLIVNAAAESAFIAAGLRLPADEDKRDKALAKVMRLLDTDGVEIDERGRPVGLRSQIEDLKATYPALFADETRRRPARVDAADRGPGAPRKMSATERQMAAFFNQ